MRLVFKQDRKPLFSNHFAKILLEAGLLIAGKRNEGVVLFPLFEAHGVFFRQRVSVARKKRIQRRKNINRRRGNNEFKFFANLARNPHEIVNSGMFVKIRIKDEQDMLHSGHVFYHAQKLDIRLPEPGPAAYDIYDQVGGIQVVLYHGKVQGIGGVTSLAVRDFNIFFKPAGIDAKL